MGITKFAGVNILGQLMTAGENISQYDLVCLKSDGKVWRARSDLADCMPVYSMALAAITAESIGRILCSGNVTNAGWSFTPGGLVYCSQNYGQLQTGLPIRDFEPLVMTAADAPTPFEADSGAYAEGFEAWKAFDGDPATGWKAPVMNYTPTAIEGMTVYEADIAGLSAAAACVVTWTSHGLTNGETVQFWGITQDADTWNTLNGSWTITYIDANSFSIAKNTSTYAAYNAGTDPGKVGRGYISVTWEDHGLTDGDTVRCFGITQADWIYLNNIDKEISEATEDTFRISRYAQSHEAYVPATDNGVIGEVTDVAGSFWIDLGLNNDRKVLEYNLTNMFPTWTAVDLAGLSRANPCVVTWEDHGLITGQYVSISGITQSGWTPLNTRYPITYVDEDSFSININSSGYAAAYEPSTDPGTIVRSDLIGPATWTFDGKPGNNLNATAIEGLSAANPCVVTATGHGLASGAALVISGITQDSGDSDWTALNGSFSVTYVDEDHFSVAVDTSAYTTPYDAGTDPGTFLVSWVQLDSQSNATYTGSDARRYYLNDPDFYRFYRLNVSASQCIVEVGVAEMSFILYETNLQIVGQALTATTLQVTPNQLLVGVA